MWIALFCFFAPKFAHSLHLYSLEFGLKQHVQAIHEGVKYTCDQCGKQVTQKQSLKLHVQTLHIQSAHEDTKFTCSQCDKQFTSKGYLKLHIQSAHEGVKFPCTQCDKQFSLKSNLYQHIQ